MAKILEQHKKRNEMLQAQVTQQSQEIARLTSLLKNN
jgi:hypothetical protein